MSGAELPKLILLDLVMPEMDGWHFRWQQVGSPELAQIPVVILSGERDVQRTATTLGAAGYVSKPVNLTSLIGTLRQAYPQ